MNQKARKKKEFSELQAKWYGRLEKAGFEDIEDTSNPERPLKEWHGHKFKSERSRLRQAEKERYHDQIADFINGTQFDEICGLIVRHGNSSLSALKVRKIVELHQGGLTERKIALKVRRSKKCVHITLKKVKAWMKVA